VITLHHRRFPHPICCDALPGGNPLVPGRTGDGAEDASRLSRCLEYNSPVAGRHRHRQLCGHVLCGSLLQCDHHMVLLLPLQITTGNHLSYTLELAHCCALGISKYELFRGSVSSTQDAAGSLLYLLPVTTYC